VLHVFVDFIQADVALALIEGCWMVNLSQFMATHRN